MTSETITDQPTAELRPLTDTEVDEASGAILPLLLGVLAFEAGMVGGIALANYKYTGNVWGHWNF